MSIVKRTTSVLLAAGVGASLWAQGVICSGAEIYSKQSVKYGRWDIRMKMAGTPGSVSSFFTYYNNSAESGQEWREIDIELLGKQPRGFQSNVILAAGSNAYKGTHSTNDDLSSTFHTYTLIWTPDSVVWRLDGNLVRSESRSTVVKSLQSQSQSYRMNLWSSSSVDWVGSLDLSKLPIYQVVNWMRYSNYTPGAGPQGSNFTESWVDDFSSFSSTRWSKGDWTFETNQAHFRTANLATREGYLILALTRPDQEGMPQSFPKDPSGNTYTTSVSDRVASGSFKAWNVSSGLRIEGAGAAAVQVLDAQGRLVAQARSGETTIPLASKGVLFVRAGELSTTVVR